MRVVRYLFLIICSLFFIASVRAQATHWSGDGIVIYYGTEMLINELVKHDKQFQLMAYPNRTHSISEGEGTSRHLADLFTSYLKKNCPGGGR